MTIACLLAASVNAQFSKSSADNLVLNTILASEINEVDVYSSINPKSGNIQLITNENISCTYANNYVYFVDDMPYSAWGHPCRYIFVNTQTGAYSIISDNIYPKNKDTDFQLLSSANHPVAVSSSSRSATNTLQANEHLKAVIVCLQDYQNNWNDVSLVYNTLIQKYGYTKDNIIVHYGKYGTSNTTHGNDLDGGTASNDLDYSAYSSAIHATFNELAGNTNANPNIVPLEAYDQLSVFFTDVYVFFPQPEINLWGLWADNGGSPNIDYEDPAEIASLIDDINCAQTTITFSINSAKGIADNFENSNKNRYIHTACDVQEFKQFEQYISGGMYSEYLFYWAAAARNAYPIILQPWLESEWQVGSFPFTSISGLGDHPGDFVPDTDGDGYEQMGEAFLYADKMDTWSNDGYYYKPYTSGIVESPQSMESIPFQEDLLTLTGFAGHVTNSQTIAGRNYLIGGDLIVDGGNTLNLSSGGGFYLGNELANINVENSADLIVVDNIEFYGDNNNQIIVNGNVQLGQNVTFNRHGNIGYFTGLLLNNSTMQTTIDNATFNETLFINYGAELDIANTTFNNCPGAFSYSGDITIDECTFNETYLSLQNSENDPDLLARVYNSTFNNVTTEFGIDISHYNDYWIENSDIRADIIGVQINNCGIDDYTSQHLLNNKIHDCNSTGVLFYNSKGSIAKNHIFNNNMGVRMFNKSNIALLGNPSATSNMETNYITNNDSYELYISKYSFPWYFRYNSIIDENNAGNPNDPLLYFNYPTSGRVNQKDIQYNCWGNNFVDYEDLYPHAYFTWSPTWCPGDGIGGLSAAEQMYVDANEQIESQGYNEAKLLYKQIVEIYPESEYAVSAMKELVRLEKFAGNDYYSLKDYYNTNESVQNDTILRDLSASLANDCDVKLENWTEAVDYYENTIIEPVSIEDSVFAIIDLGYTYFLMENANNKSAYTGQLTQFKPESKEKFFDHRDYLLSLLPDKSTDKSKNNISTLKEGELLQNVPNPFTMNTQIWYKLESKATVQLNVYNYTGQLISTIKGETKPEGTHYFDFNSAGYSSGIYFYSISING